MKNNKRKIALMLVLVLLASICFTTQRSIQAAGTTKLKKTLYVGQKFVFKPVTSSNPFTSAKSSNKKVATVKKNSKNKVTITAKKKGKAVITIKTKLNVTYKYTITVKSKSSTWKAFAPYDVLNEDNNLYTSYVMFEVVNTSGIYAKEANVSYDLYGVSGKKVASGVYNVKELLPNAKAHFFGIGNNLTEKVKSGKVTKVNLVQEDSATKFKYTNRNDKIVISELEKSADSLRVSIKNNFKEGVRGIADIIFYKDAASKHPIGMSTIDIYTNANGSNIESVTPTKGYKSYKIFKRAYTSKYTG